MTLLAISLGILIALLVPVSLRFDSTERYLKLGWLGLSVTKDLGRKKPRTPREKPEKERKRTIKVIIGRCLLKDRDLCLELFQKGYRSARDMVKAVSIRELDVSFSTPDPMWNGVLCGIFANIHLENVTLGANFQNLNQVRGWLRFYPYKVIQVAAVLMIRLPYRRIIRTALYIRRHERKEESP